MLDKEKTSFVIAKLAKDKGFNDEYGVSSNDLASWLRSVHNIDLIVYPSFLGKMSNYYYIIIINRDFDK